MGLLTFGVTSPESAASESWTTLRADGLNRGPRKLGSYAPMSVAVPEQVPLLLVGELGRLMIVWQASPFRSPGQRERSRGAGCARYGERGGDRQHVAQTEGRGPGPDAREEKSAHGTPPRKARQRHLIEPASTLHQHEEAREGDAGDEAEHTEEQWDRRVGVDAQHPTRNAAHQAQGYCPGEAHPDCTTDASQQHLHDRLRLERRSAAQPTVAQPGAKSFVIQSTGRGTGFKCR